MAVISSVIATFDCDLETLVRTRHQIDRHAALEPGEPVDGRKLPIVMEAADHRELEETTRWLNSLDGIAFVDVVFVHLESDEHSNKGRAGQYGDSFPSDTKRDVTGGSN